MSKITWTPASPDSIGHASTRIRSAAVLEWLAQFQRDLAFEIAPGFPVAGKVAVVFKRPGHVFEAVRTRAKAIIFDISDNHFADEDPGAEARAAAYWQACSLATVVVCSTLELAKVVTPHARRVVAIPDSVDPIARKVPKLPPQYRISKSAIWFGAWGSKHQSIGGMRDLLTIREPLDRWLADGLLTVISNNPDVFATIGEQFYNRNAVVYAPFDPLRFPNQLALHQIALVPVTLTPYTICKSHNRVTLAAAAGLHVIASPHPAYEEFRCTTHDFGLSLDAGGYEVPPDTLAPYSIDRVGTLWTSLLEEFL